jgi:hypothetical protein
MRTFPSGSTRDEDKEKIDPEGFLSPIVIQRYCEYMQKHRVQADCNLRESDNWQRGMEKSVYMKSLWRHFLDLHALHRGFVVYKEKTPGGEKTHILFSKLKSVPKNWKQIFKEDALGGLTFNTSGYWFEYLKNEKQKEEKK